MGKGRKPELTDWLQSDECNRIIELSRQGYSIGRIAEITGVKYSRVTYARRLKGFKSDRPFGTDGINYKDSKFATHEVSQVHNHKEKQESESRLAFILLDKGFSYLGGYKGLHNKSEIRISCLVCGGTFTRQDAMSLFKSKNLFCPYCVSRTREQQERDREEKRKAREEQRLNLKLEEEQKEQEKLNAEQVCKWCGKSFTLAEYREREHTNHCQFTVYCSSDCRTNAQKKALKEWNKEHKYKARHKERAIKYGCEYDNKVTLKRLIKRDGLRCAICGGMCDLNDRSYGNGNGPLYPSMDHIIPMVKRGGHTWDNVQVAHNICNAIKGAKIEEKYGNAL